MMRSHMANRTKKIVATASKVIENLDGEWARKQYEIVWNTGAKRLYVPDGTQNQYGRRWKRLVCKHPWFSLLIALFM